MNAKEYIKNVLVTEARDLSPVKERLQIEKNIRLIHACAGISSEITEIIEAMRSADGIDRVNLMEEFGDLSWYIGIAADALESSELVMDYVPGTSISSKTKDAKLREFMSAQIEILTELAGTLNDIAIKNLIFYGKKIDDMIISEVLLSLHVNIVFSLQAIGFTVQEARERNIAKLRARYGEKFTEAAALDRNLAAERDILEGK